MQKCKVVKLDEDVYEIQIGCKNFSECYVERGHICVGDEEVGVVYYCDYFFYGNHIESDDYDDLDSLKEHLKDELDLSDHAINKIIFN